MANNSYPKHAHHDYNTAKVTEYRRCKVGQGHYWNVRTGEMVSKFCPNLQYYWFQDCEYHGGKNTVDYALKQGIKEESAKLALQPKE